MNGRTRIPTSIDGCPAPAWRGPWWAAAGAMALAAVVFAWPLFETGAQAGAQAGTQNRLAGPVPAQVLSVIDGDTIEVRAVIWLGQVLSTRVRLAGIDAPELRGKCARERALAVRARDYLLAKLAAKLEDGERAWVRLRDIRYGKYAGRVLARVETAGGEDLGRGLMAAGLARPYAGRARESWCEEAGAPSSG